MARKTNIDVDAAHKHFSVTCFNKAWELIDKTDRSPEEDEQMIRLSMAAMWHWTQRDDFTPKNASIGYWQLSRIFALVGRGDHAEKDDVPFISLELIRIAARQAPPLDLLGPQLLNQQLVYAMCLVIPQKGDHAHRLALVLRQLAELDNLIDDCSRFGRVHAIPLTLHVSVLNAYGRDDWL